MGGVPQDETLTMDESDLNPSEPSDDGLDDVVLDSDLDLTLVQLGEDESTTTDVDSSSTDEDEFEYMG